MSDTLVHESCLNVFIARSQGEPTVETLVSYDTDQNKEEIEDVFHIQGREMENESNSDLKDIQLVAGNG